MLCLGNSIGNTRKPGTLQPPGRKVWPQVQSPLVQSFPPCFAAEAASFVRSLVENESMAAEEPRHPMLDDPSATVQLL